jgi:hypothetical protein
VIALAIAACGDQEAAPAPAAGAALDLTVTIDPDGPGGEPPRRKSVECAAEGCSGIELADFDPVPPGTACTEIYGGPDVATVEGELLGEHVRARLTRANGCEIERFDRFADLLTGAFPDYTPGRSVSP